MIGKFDTRDLRAGSELVQQALTWLEITQVSRLQDDLGAARRALRRMSKDTAADEGSMHGSGV